MSFSKNSDKIYTENSVKFDFNKDLLFNKNKVLQFSLLEKLFYYSLFLLPVGLLFGEVPTSISEIIVVILWLSSQKWKNFSYVFKNQYFWLLSSLFLIHIIGLLNTTDFDYALNDLRIKIPLILFPIIFFTITLSKNFIVNFLKWFCIVVFINLSYLLFHQKFFSQEISDTRNASIFISHIRLGLISAFSIVCTAYLIINYLQSIKEKLLFIILGIITLLLMLSLGLMTGIFTLLITTFFSIVYMILSNSNRIYTTIISAISIIFIISMIFYTKSIYKKYFPNINLHSTNNDKPLSQYTENGYIVFDNNNEPQLKKEWEKRSMIPYDGKDKKNNDLKYTLFRYLTSKGLSKDSLGLAQLTEKEITDIENGYPNYHYVNASFLEKRIYELIQEYNYFKISKDPNGKTIVLRLFYWNIAFKIWMKNFWFGVGTGDVASAYKIEYQNYQEIHPSAQLRAHNQILTYALTFGILGLIIILLSYFHPLFTLSNSEDYLLFFMYSIITLISYLIDDTFETQPSVTFFAIFNTLLIKFCLENSKEKLL
jgi:hypothetical protein